MIPLKLTLKNFLSYQSPAPIDFSNLKVAVLTGPNGVGKTSLLEAITWALWGKTRANSADDLIYQGKNKCFVELIFKSEKKIYRVLRQRHKPALTKTGKQRPGSTQLIFQIAKHQTRDFFNQTNFEWEELTGATLKTTQEEIVKTLNLTYEIFTNSSYLRQGKADEFTLKPPQQRKEILSQILDLKHFQIYEERAREKQRLLDQELEVQTLTLNEKKAEAKQLQAGKGEWKKIEQQFKKIAQQLKEAEKKFNQRTNQYQLYQEKKAAKEALKNNLETQRYELKQTIERYQKIRQQTSRLPALKKQLKRLPFSEKKLSRLQLESEQLRQKQHAKIQLESQREHILELWEREKKDFKKMRQLKICPTCQQEVKSDHIEQVIQNKRIKFSRTYRPKLQKIQQQLKILSRIDQTLKDKLIEIERLRASKEKFQALNFEIQQLQALAQELPDLKQNILKRKKVYLENQKKLTTLSQFLIKHQASAIEYAQAEKELTLLRQNYQEHSERLGAVKEQKNRLKKLKEALSKAQSKIKQLNEERKLMEQLTYVFSQRGVPATIIQETIPQIEAEANLILAKATNNKMKLEFKTKRAKKSQLGEIDTLDIIISDKLGERAYELFSGGEAFRINFAIRVALSRLLSIRAGAKLKFLAIDEGFGALDTVGQEDIIKSIKSVADDFEKIFVVSHINEIKDTFDQLILVSKNEQGSQVEIIT